MGVFKDKIVFAWGGDLNFDNSSSRVVAKGIYSGYYDVATRAWHPNAKTLPTTTHNFTNEQDAMQSVSFVVLQDTNGKKTMSGNISFYIYQTSRSNKETNCVSRYFHRIVGINPNFSIVSGSKAGTAASVAVSAANSLTGSWDYSIQRNGGSAVSY